AGGAGFPTDIIGSGDDDQIDTSIPLPASFGNELEFIRINVGIILRIAVALVVDGFVGINGDANLGIQVAVVGRGHRKAYVGQLVIGRPELRLFNAARHLGRL